MRFNECMCWYLKPFLGQRDDLKKKKIFSAQYERFMGDNLTEAGVLSMECGTVAARVVTAAVLGSRTN